MAREDIVISIRAEIGKAQQKIKELGKSSNHQYKRIATVQQQVFEKTTQLNKALGQTPFAGYAMSLMFAGMAIQRVFMSMWKFGTKAFTDIAHSVEGTVTQGDILAGSMKYLGYTIGAALDPILGFIAPIVDELSEWASLHPGLTAGVIALGAALGTLFMVGGMGKLAINGFRDMIAIWTGAGSVLSKVFNSPITQGFLDSIDKATASLGGIKGMWSKIKTALAIAAIAVVAYKIGSKPTNEPWTTTDWITNLGMATAAGWMLGGPYGALAAFLITGVVMLSKDAIAKTMKGIEQVRNIQQKLLSGEILTAEEAMKVNFQGTTLPQDLLNEINKNNKILINSVNRMDPDNWVMPKTLKEAWNVPEIDVDDSKFWQSGLNYLTLGLIDLRDKISVKNPDYNPYTDTYYNPPQITNYNYFNNTDTETILDVINSTATNITG